MSDKLAEVVELTERKTAKVRFDGEESISEKEYPYLRSYVPKIGDKVFMKSFNGSYIIFDAISFEVEPDDLKTEITTQVNTLKTELERDYINKIELERDYLKVNNLKDEITNNHLKGEGASLIYSDVASDVNGSHNIWYMYINPTTGNLHVRRVNGLWSEFVKK